MLKNTLNRFRVEEKGEAEKAIGAIIVLIGFVFLIVAFFAFIKQLLFPYEAPHFLIVTSSSHVTVIRGECYKEFHFFQKDQNKCNLEEGGILYVVTYQRLPKGITAEEMEKRKQQLETVY